MLFKVSDVMFNYSDKELYSGISFQLNQGEHAVLIGQNGSGKTTIFDLLTKKITPDKGKIEWTSGISYSYLDQHYKVNDDFTIKEFLEQTYIDLFNKEKEMNDLYLKGSDYNDPKYFKYIERASEINEELIMSDFYSIKERIEKVIVGLGISKDRLNTKLSLLSSGQKEKVYLAKMLLEENDVLLLDEPTNYLDVAHVEWLASYLENYPKAFLVISHDEAFVRRIANVIFYLTNKKIERYKGNYDYFLEQSQIRKEQYEKNYDAQQKYIKKEEEFIAAHIVRATSSRMAKSRRTRLEHLEKLDAPVDDTNNVSISFPYSGDIGELVLDVDKLVVGYDFPLLKPLSFSLHKGDKIAIVGKNGIGKTTLIKTLMKLIPALNGSFSFNKSAKIGYFSQTELDDLNISPFDYIHSFFPKLTTTEVRNALARCGIKSTLATRKLSELSGGEEAKSRLTLLTLQKTNILVLDEPTNHLDKIAKESLKNAIKEYPGVVIIVSHEKEFVNGLTNLLLNFQ